MDKLLRRETIMKPLFLNSSFNRRCFLRKAAVAGGVIVLPNLITQRLFAGVCKITDVSGVKYIELKKATFARKFDVGTWTSVRIGVHLHVVDTGGNITNPSKFYLGLCSDAAGQVLQADAKFIGIWANQWYRTSVQGYTPYGAPEGEFGKYIDGTWTTVTTGLNCAITFPSYGSNCFLLTITKTGASTYTMACHKDASAGDARTTAQFEAGMIAITPNLSANYDTESSGTVTQDFSSYPLNMMNVGWDCNDTSIRVNEIMVVKIS